jgi:hypothetical protein
MGGDEYEVLASEEASVIVRNMKEFVRARDGR